MTTPPWLTWWLAAALFVLFLGMNLTPLTNNDIWLHMANGRWILDHGQVPLTDPYSFSAAGERFHAHEWLAGVVFHLVYQLSGVNGLIFLKTTLGAAALALLAMAARRLGAGPLALLTTLLLALVIVNSRFLERPEMFSFAFTALYIWVLTQEHLQQRNSIAEPNLSASAPVADSRWPAVSLLWWLVPVQWAWVQIHGYFLTGLALLGAFLLADSIEYLRRPGTDGIRLKRLVSGWLALAVMALLGLANPNGYEIYTFPFELAGGDNIFMRTVFEWGPTFTTGVMTQSSMFLGFTLWLALLTVAHLDQPTLLRRKILWNAVTMSSLLALVKLRSVVAAGSTLPSAWQQWIRGEPMELPPPAAGSGLQASAWLWSPAEWLASVSGHYGFQTLLAPLFSPLRLLGPWGDDIYTLMLLALLLLAVLTWRQPVLAGLTGLSLTMMIVLMVSGSWAVAILSLTFLPSLIWAVFRRQVPLWQLAISAVFLALAVRQNRNIVNFALVTLPLFAVALTRMGTALRRGLPPERRGNGTAAVAVMTSLLALLTFTSGWPYTPSIPKKVGLGVGTRIPTGAVDYIRQAGIKGQVFNKYAYGAYIIHELFPESRVFMDSRNGVYGPVLYKQYLETLRDPEVAAATFEQYRFDYLALDYQFYPGRSKDQGLHSYLSRRPEWVLVEFDDTSLVYVRDNDQHQDLIRRDGYRYLDPAAYRPGSLRRADSQTLAGFSRESARAFQRHPNARSSRLLRAESEMLSGNSQEALMLLESVLNDNPDDVYPLITAARIARSLGDIGRAHRHYTRALELRPASQELQEELRLLLEEAL